MECTYRVTFKEHAMQYFALCPVAEQRPVDLRQVLEQVCEKLVKKLFTSFLKQNKTEHVLVVVHVPYIH